MADQVGAIEYDASIQTSKFKGDAREIDRIAKQTGGNVASRFQNMSKKMSSSITNAGNRGKAALNTLAKRGFMVLGAAVGLSIKNFIEQEKVMKQTETVIKSTKGAAGLAAHEISEMASSLQKVTTFGDEAIQGGQNLLLTFTKIGKDVFPQATETMLDMSEALGQDMKSSAIQLGKALNDPIRGAAALRRVGVSFTEQQQDQIKTLVESGKTLEAQKLILGELKTEFGGTARAAALTFGGSIKQVKNILGDLSETVGGVIAKSIQPLISKFSDFVKSIDPKEVERRTQGIVTAINSFVGDLDQAWSQDKVNGVMRVLMTKLATGFALAVPTLVASSIALLIQISPSIVKGFIDGLIKAAKENPMNFAIFFAALGLTPLVVTTALGQTLSGIPIIGPIFKWMLQAMTTVSRFLLSPIRGMFTKLGAWSVAHYKAGVAGLGKAGAWVLSWISSGLTRIMPSVATRFAALGTTAAAAFQLALAAGVAIAIAGVIKVAWEAIKGIKAMADNAASYTAAEASLSNFANKLRSKGVSEKEIQRQVNKIRMGAPRRASGGPVDAGRPYMVGEKGPEMFMPNRKGYIVSNSDLQKLGQNMSPGKGVVIHLNMSGVMARSRMDLREIAKDMIESINEELRSKNLSMVANVRGSRV